MMRWEKLQVTDPRSPVSEDGASVRKRGRKGGSLGPGHRWGHSVNCVPHGKTVYVFGGYGDDQTNEVHVYNRAADKWTKPNMKGIGPGPRDSHTATLLRSKIYVFAGTDGSHGLNDLFSLETATNTWSPVTPLSPAMPPAREGHAAASLKDKLFVFGGCGKGTSSLDHDIYFNDTFCFDAETQMWAELETSGELPVPRDSHSCCIWEKFLVVFGGEDSGSSYLDDVHLLDTNTLEWTKLETSGDKPRARAGHASVVIGQSLIIFGGFAEDRHLFNDVYVLDLTTGEWQAHVPEGNAPTPRFSLAADVLDPWSGQVFLFGGCNDSLEALDDIFILHTGMKVIPPAPAPSTEKLSLKKELKRRIQLGQAGDSGAHISPHLSAPSKSLAPASAIAKPAAAGASFEPRTASERLFEAQITGTFHYGFTIQTSIDGFALDGMLFSFKPEFQSEPLTNQLSFPKAVEPEPDQHLTEDSEPEAKHQRVAAAGKITGNGDVGNVEAVNLNVGISGEQQYPIEKLEMATFMDAHYDVSQDPLVDLDIPSTLMEGAEEDEEHLELNA